MAYPDGTNAISYRPHIDGLRGVAVILVVLYHARFLSVGGGFIGVDVFFVISGFLITSIIMRDVQAGTFSLIGFWERRIRRIVPVVVAVILATSIASYALILYPPEYHDFGTTVIAQSLFASNMLFAVTDNYFEQSARYSPLLHTWSLSVEEQFYLVFPGIVFFCVWFAKRKGRIIMLTERWGGQRMLLGCVLILGFISFLINIWFVNVAPASVFSAMTYGTAGFYLLPSRAWEIGVGILIALYPVCIRSIVWSEILALTGIGSVMAAAFLFSDSTHFPGVAALLPTLGAAAIIVANESHITKVGAVLAYPGLVWVGLISYSLYLWHWPLFAFANLTATIPISNTTALLLMLTSVVLAWLSYRFIETPFRKKVFFPLRRDMLYFGFASLMLLSLLGFLIQRTSGEVINRVPLVGKNILLASAENVPWGGVCSRQFVDEALCSIGDIGSIARGADFVVWGDSHAEALVPLFNTLGRAYGVRGTVFDGAFCIPVNGVHQLPAATSCEEETTSALAYIQKYDIHTVFLISRWSYYVMGGSSGDSKAFITDSEQASVSSKEAVLVLEKNLTAMVREWSREGREVVLVKQVPEQFDFNIRDAFYRAVHLGERLELQSIKASRHQMYQTFPNAVIDSLGALPGVRIIDPAAILCEKGGVCALENKGKLIYRDEDHISTAGAMSLEALFTQVFIAIKTSSKK
ncbi:MAG: acyltransferase [Parcubacteria group bacterium]|nr:acyltransferase [Parcubacteria group bacterium]